MKLTAGTQELFPNKTYMSDFSYFEIYDLETYL